MKNMPTKRKKPGSLRGMTSMTSYELHTGSGSDFIIRIMGESPDQFRGSVEHLQSDQVCEFNSFLEMLMLIQQRLDRVACPQMDTELRTF